MSQSRVLILNVSPGGPITSLEEARDEIRRIRPPDGFPDGGVAIEIEGGTYELKDPLTLDERDSGTEASPIVYRSKPGEYVRLTGGSVVDGFEPVTDPEVLKRLAPEAVVFQVSAIKGDGIEAAAEWLAERCKGCR